MAERRAACRYCRQEVLLGKHGWRLDNNDPSGYVCKAAPLGYHGVDKPSKNVEEPGDVPQR